MKTLISILLLLITQNAIAFDEQGSASNSSQLDVDVAVVCEYHTKFKDLNKVLCAAAEEVRATPQPIMIEKVLACLYPTVRDDLRLCSQEEVEKMDLPFIPFLEGELPYWPDDMEPVLLKVNGRALNTVLPMHSSFFNDEFSLEASCASEDGDLRKTDRILCAPFVAELPLDDAGKYDGDPRDLIIDRLKKQISKLEKELATPEPVVAPKIVVEEPQEPQEMLTPMGEAKPEDVPTVDKKTKDDTAEAPVKEKPKPLKVYGR
jgi:hypothetical protein